MARYQLRMFYQDGDPHTAGSKATLDCSAILSTIGFKKIDVPVYARRSFTPLNILRTLKALLSLYFMLQRGSTILIQYPLLGINRFIKQLAQALKWRGCRTIILIHDVDSLRAHGANRSTAREIETFNTFDFVISHNRTMTAKLRSEGLTAETVELELFDYLSTAQETQKDLQVDRLSVAFAGNLGKSEFLNELKQIQSVDFHLYGPGFLGTYSASNIQWKGSFPPEELPGMLNAGFGLIWDGHSIQECQGSKGNYLRYNNPHKASLYLVAGLPLIAPAESAIAALIKEKNIGFTINSLFELSGLLQRLSEAEYTEMYNNVQKLKKTLSAGGNLIRSIQDLESRHKLGKA